MARHPQIKIKHKKRKLKSLFKGKVPDGIVPELGISEARRDELKKRDFSGPAKQKPANQRHPDTWTTNECKELRYSGYRKNVFTGMVELWVLGHIRAEAKIDDVERIGPAVLAEMHNRVFDSNAAVLIGDKLPGDKR